VVRCDQALSERFLLSLWAMGPLERPVIEQGRALGAIHISQVPEGGWPRPLRQMVDGPVRCPEESLDSVKNKVSGAHK